MKPPRFLYKYQSIDEFTIDNLKNRRLYFRNPRKLDDPFDCSYRIKRRPRSPEEYRKVRNEIRSKFPDGVPDEYDIDNEYTAEHGNPLLRTVLEEQLDTIGVTCFSERYDILLMWSLYAKGHTGFCLEFDTQFYPFTQPEEYVFQVTYKNTIPTIDIFDLVLYPLKAVGSIIKTKANRWKFQKEWRIINNQGDITENLGDVRCVSGIYIGCKMSAPDKKTIVDILENTQISCNEMFMDENQSVLRTRKWITA